MKKVFLTLAVLVMAICASAQKNQYFWYQGNLMLGNPIAQIDSVTFGTEDTDSILVYLPRTIIKTVEVHDTVYITIHDTVCPDDTPDTTHNGFRYVDLGLSVMWADANVGAEAPEDYGSYFAWGEIEPKESYHWYNYKYGQYKTMSKYCLDSDHGTVDGLSTLLPEDDAASVNMGGTWRTPTKAEWQELIDNCILTFDTISSHPGLRYTASNGKSIFIPLAGDLWYSSCDDWEETFGSDCTIGKGAKYWTSNVDPEYSAGAFCFTNREHYDTFNVVGSWDRHVGATVRGVFSK